MPFEIKAIAISRKPPALADWLKRRGALPQELTRQHNPTTGPVLAGSWEPKITQSALSLSP